MYRRLPYRAVRELHVSICVKIGDLPTRKNRAIWGKESAHCFRTVGRLYATAIEKEPDRCRSLSLSLTEGIHQLLEGSGTLDLEEDLVVVIGDLDVEMLILASLRLLGGTWASVVVRARHVGRRRRRFDFGESGVRLLRGLAGVLLQDSKVRVSLQDCGEYRVKRQAVSWQSFVVELRRRAGWWRSSSSRRPFAKKRAIQAAICPPPR